MRDNPKLLKKWLFSYLFISVILFAIGHLWFFLGISNFASPKTRALVINVIYFIVTFFFYAKITQKSIWWILTTLFLAYFLSFLSSFFSTIFNNSGTSLVDYVFPIFFCIFNMLFMFAGVYIESKTPIKKWNDDILDDIDK